MVWPQQHDMAPTVQQKEKKNLNISRVSDLMKYKTEAIKKHDLLT